MSLLARLRSLLASRAPRTHVVTADQIVRATPRQEWELVLRDVPADNGDVLLAPVDHDYLERYRVLRVDHHIEHAYDDMVNALVVLEVA